MKRYSGLFLFLLVLLPGLLHAEDGWQLVREGEGVKAYTRFTPGSPFVSCRVVCEVDAPLEAVRELLHDSAMTTRWYQHLRECRELRRGKNNLEFLYYFVFQGIWPVADRDLVAHVRITRDDSDVFICEVSALDEGSVSLVPLNRKYVRVKTSMSTFRLTRIERSRTLLMHETTADPAGIVPAFLVNLYMAQVPFQALRNMRTLLNGTGRDYRVAGIPPEQ
jgi:hypothetical protein